jgi:predicted secreted protein
MTPTPRQTNCATVTTTAPVARPTARLRLFVEQGPSPWLAQLSRHDLEEGSSSRMVSAGIRGVPAVLFVSVEAPPVSDETAAAPVWARRLHQQIDRHNLLVAIPATPGPPGRPH